ncbi:MAG: DUF1801 domain-containing protein [Hyphomicrobiaceae bacterium]
MAENKTQPTGAPVAAFVESLPSAKRQQEAAVLIAMLEAATNEPPRMWGPSIVGFGTQEYVTAGGRRGEMPVVAFSPRKAALVLYVGRYLATSGPLLQRLGKHTAGKGCLYVRKLSDVDSAVLEAIVRAEVAASAAARAP